MEKLFTLLVFGWVILAAVKILVFWITQKLLHPTPKTTKRNSRVDAQAKKVSAQFNQLLKARALSREDILIIRNQLKKYACKRYTNDAHMIYSVLKHGNVRMNELGSLEIFLDSKKRKIKC